MSEESEGGEQPVWAVKRNCVSGEFQAVTLCLSLRRREMPASQHFS